MSNQGYPDEGSDRRLLSGLGWLQRSLILRWAAPKDVEHITRANWRIILQVMPPFVMFEFRTAATWHQIRLGWTWRMYQKYYIPGAAIKTETGLEPDYTNLT